MRWFVRPVGVSMIVVAFVTALCGCRPTDQSDALESTESSFATQVSAVDAGNASEIHLGKQVLTDELLVDQPILPELTTFHADHSRLTAIGYQQLAELAPGLERLELPSGLVDDEGLAEIGRLRKLQLLNVPGLGVTDQGIEHLLQLTDLRVLNLHQSQISDASLSKMMVLTHLQLLRFGSPLVTDEGMASIAKMESLTALHLMEVPISDLGLRYLSKMTWLQSFYLDGGKTTEEGLEALLEALPRLHFHFDQQHLYSDPHNHSH